MKFEWRIADKHSIMAFPQGPPVSSARDNRIGQPFPVEVAFFPAFGQENAIPSEAIAGQADAESAQAILEPLPESRLRLHHAQPLSIGRR